MVKNILSTRNLNGLSSLLLDGLRLLCAMIVFWAHSNAVWHPEREMDLLPSHLSHAAVVVFFVLSGYVIAHTTAKKKRTYSEYAVARLSRLYSIFFPAIIVTAICAVAAYVINPSVYSVYDRGNNIFRYFLSLFFCNELWFLSAAPLINGPIWSLGYEFWFYVLFGLFYYRIKGVKGYILPVLGLVIVGPKILAMMVIWWMGWAAYHIKPVKLNIAAGRSLFFLLLMATFVLALYLPPIPYVLDTPPLYWAGQFLTDWILGIIVSLAVWILPTQAERKLQEHSVIVHFRGFANMTFPIYVLHFPILVCMKCWITRLYIKDGLSSSLGIFLSLLLCIILGYYFESKKDWWRRAFSALFVKINSVPIFK